MQEAEKAWPNRWSVAATLVAITLFAFLIRYYYVCTAVVDRPFRGDALQYLAYARNLVTHRIFSIQPPWATPTPDSFRDPGYPAFLALILSVFDHNKAFYAAVLIAQSCLSALTVGIYSFLALRFFSVTAAIVVGIALALWPHLIVLSGSVLSETLLGFLIAAAVLCLTVAIDRRSIGLGCLAGATIAAAGLTNAVLAPIIPLVAAVAVWRDTQRRRLWSAVLLTALLPIVLWGGRNALLSPEQGPSDRAAVNLVQGSWPEYHDAWMSAVAQHDASSIAIMRAVEAEQEQMRSNALGGLKMIASRLSAQPLRYLRWYASKPVELWGWTIGIGSGDIYVFPTQHSPLSVKGPLKVTTDIAFLLNRLVMFLAVVGLVMTFHRASDAPPGLRIAALIATYATLVFATLQADVRYSVPYRGIEWLLAYGAIHWITLWSRRIPKGGKSEGPG